MNFLQLILCRFDTCTKSRLFYVLLRSLNGLTQRSCEAWLLAGRPGAPSCLLTETTSKDNENLLSVLIGGLTVSEGLAPSIPPPTTISLPQASDLLFLLICARAFWSWGASRLIFPHPILKDDLMSLAAAIAILARGNRNSVEHLEGSIWHFLSLFTPSDQILNNCENYCEEKKCVCVFQNPPQNIIVPRSSFLKGKKKVFMVWIEKPWIILQRQVFSKCTVRFHES